MEASDDPDRERVYAAEAAALTDGGRPFTRFTAVVDYVESVVLEPWWEMTFPDAPIEVEVGRRSRGATFSCAMVSPERDAGILLIRDGSWDAATIVHELAHFATMEARPFEPPHGPRFVDALTVLWRRHLGVHAYGALCSALDDTRRAAPPGTPSGRLQRVGLDALPPPADRHPTGRPPPVLDAGRLDGRCGRQHP